MTTVRQILILGRRSARMLIDKELVKLTRTHTSDNIQQLYESNLAFYPDSQVLTT